MSGVLLSVRGLQVRFGTFAAVKDVTFDLSAGETVGLVGESGSGKSTLARAVLRLVPAAGGEILWSGDDMLAWSAKQLRQRRRDMQIVFQDPLASLDPRMSAAHAIAEPLEIFEPALSAAARRSRVCEMLERVGLSAQMADRHPHEFSGGQCQRIGIARAMILRPRLLVCDEPVSSLDVSIQGQIVNLLADLQEEWGTAMLFISHNLAVVRHLSHRVLVMYRGSVVEVAARETLFAAPAHPYTRALLAAVPDPIHGWAGAASRDSVSGDAAPRHAVSSDVVSRVESSADTVSSGARAAEGEEAALGCAYQGRCRHAQGTCHTTVPPLEEVSPGHSVACHRWHDVGVSLAP